jgi:hypothetical protein
MHELMIDDRINKFAVNGKGHRLIVFATFEMVLLATLYTNRMSPCTAKLYTCWNTFCCQLDLNYIVAFCGS